MLLLGYGRPFPALCGKGFSVCFSHCLLPHIKSFLLKTAFRNKGMTSARISNPASMQMFEGGTHQANISLLQLKRKRGHEHLIN
ncbi:hypothetical protein, partial [Akkermansia sp.]|uniref:hypothetical protein n=1 Tax=Akkermansia sp. TaxID=1872421 RepID=UPI003AB45B31